MKYIFSLLLCIGLTACDPQLLEQVLSGGNTLGTTPLSNAEVVNGLRDALRIGAENAVSFTSKEGGFNANPKIRIPFPEEALRVKIWANQNGLQSQVTAFENNLNKAAEKAAKEAVPVFTEAIMGMTIEDGFGILRGDSLAATSYLKKATTTNLTARFRPIVDQVIEDINLTGFWEPISKAYNTSTLFTGQQQVNTDLGAYVTDKALTGLFYYVGDEEKKIRRDPKARVTDILVRVFGSIDK